MSWGEEQQKEIETIRERKITVKLSDADCDRLARKCGEHGLTIGELIENFVGDLVGGTYSNGSDERDYDGLDSSGRPQYTVKASMTSNPLKLKSSKLVTRAEGVNSWHTNEEDHNGYTGTNSRSYVYTTPNPPSNPYCEAILTATDEKGDEYAVWKGTLRDAK